MLRIGTQAPEFEIRTHTGLRFRLSDHRGSKDIVLFFFPRHGAWQGKNELASFSRHLRGLQVHDAVLLGVSDSSPSELETLAGELDVPVLLGTDEQLAVCRNYRVLWLRSLGIRRVTYVIDKTGTVRGVAHHGLLMERHWTHVQRILTRLREEEELASYNRKAHDL